MDGLAESVGVKSEHAWLPRSVLAGYGLVLGSAGALAAYETELFAPVRAAGVSAVVLGAGCVLLAIRGPHRPARSAPAQDREPGVEEAVVPEPPEELASVETETEPLDETEPAETLEEPDEPEAPAIPAQPAAADAEVVVVSDAVRLERLESELADERARVDRVTAELAALRRVVVEQRSGTKS